MKDKYLRETRMVDFSNPAIQKLIQNMKWKEMGEFERIKAIYNYVRDDVLFGYNIDDGISASKVLADGYGQCNTKGMDCLQSDSSSKTAKKRNAQEALCHPKGEYPIVFPEEVQGMLG